jgi:putative redox protein
MASEARVIWTGPGVGLVGGTSSGSTIVLDGGQGHEEGQCRASPMELLLIGLAGCTAVDVVAIFQKRPESFVGLEVVASAERATEHPRVYTQIHLEYVVRGRGLKPRTVGRAIRLSQEKYCSAAAMLGQVAHISTSYRIVED